MCDPLTLALAVGASVGGKVLSSQNQQSQADAANAMLAQNIGTLNKYGASNEKSLGSDLADYSPTAQSTALTGAQDARSNSAVSNISTPTQAGMNDIPTGDAPPAVKSEIAKRMLSTYDNAVSRAKAMGKVGGYGDQWFDNQIKNSQVGRDIGTTNNQADTLKSIIPAMSEDAARSKYSPLGGMVSGIGSILGSYAGGGGSMSGVGDTFGKASNIFNSSTPLMGGLPGMAS